jgi:hypothetical protein
LQPQSSVDFQNSVDYEPSAELPGSLAGEGVEDGAEGEEPSVASLREESLDEASWEDEASMSTLGDAAAQVTLTDRERVLKTRVVGGTVSAYKHKAELSAALERRAALKYIGQRKDDVIRRQQVLKEAEEAVAQKQGHIDVIDSKVCARPVLRRLPDPRCADSGTAGPFDRRRGRGAGSSRPIRESGPRAGAAAARRGAGREARGGAGAARQGGGGPCLPSQPCLSRGF